MSVGEVRLEAVAARRVRLEDRCAEATEQEGAHSQAIRELAADLDHEQHESSNESAEEQPAPQAHFHAGTLARTASDAKRPRHTAAMRGPRILVNALSMSQGGGRSYVVNLLRELRRDDRGFRFTLLASPEQLEGLDTGAVEVEALRLPREPRALRLPLRRALRGDRLPAGARASTCCTASLTSAAARARSGRGADAQPEHLRPPLLRRRAHAGAVLARAGRCTARALRRLSEPGRRRRRSGASSRSTKSGWRSCTTASRRRLSPTRSRSRPRRHICSFPPHPERHKNIVTLIESLRFVSEPAARALDRRRARSLDPVHSRELEELAARLGLGRARPLPRPNPLPAMQS